MTDKEFGGKCTAMREFQILPHKGVGPIKLGMTREEVHAIFGEPQFSHGLREQFLDGFMVDFSEENRVEFIELAKSQQFRAILEGKCLHEIPAHEVIRHVSKYGEYDRNDPELGYSYVFVDLQLSLWRGVIPTANQEPDDSVGRYFEAVGIAEDGYFQLAQ